ncbi:MAG: hypothetical protein OES09_12205 [Gammaproteobacteria bacterium]|nr:hypothetical protein [Gammaproteobacteria bacterium]
MKRMIIASLTASLMFLFTAPVYADSVQHQWFCHRLDTATMDDVIAATAVWFKAAKKNKGAENIKVSLKFPVAVDTIDGDFIQQITFPDLKAWAEFTDNYKDSPAGKAEEAWYKVANCQGSEIWNTVEYE